MIDLVRVSSDELVRFTMRFEVEPLVFSGEGVLTCGSITLLDGSIQTNKTLPSAIGRATPDLIFGCEWIGERDHMDYPQHALRIQTARSMHAASAMYVMSPHILTRKVLEVARFNARVLRRAKVPVVFASLARSEGEIAAPKDLMAIGTILGFSDREIIGARRLLDRLPQIRFGHSFSLEETR